MLSHPHHLLDKPRYPPPQYLPSLLLYASPARFLTVPMQMHWSAQGEIQAHRLRVITNTFVWRFGYLVLHCLGPSTPHHHLKSLYQANYSITLDTYPDIQNISSGLAWPVTRFLTIPTERDYHLLARLLLPPDVTTRKVMTFPLILHM